MTAQRLLVTNLGYVIVLSGVVSAGVADSGWPLLPAFVGVTALFIADVVQMRRERIAAEEELRRPK